MLIQGSRVLFYYARNFNISGLGPRRMVLKKTPEREVCKTLSTTKEEPKIKEVICKACTFKRRVGTYFDPWFWLVKFGMKKHSVIRARRRLKKFAYPWLFFAFPAGTYMLFGDGISQLCFEKQSKDKYNIMRSLHYAAIGLLITGPIASKWSLFWLRRIPRNKPTTFMATSLLLDVFLLAPVAVLLTMVCFDYKVAMNKYKDPQKLFNDRYKKSFKEILLFYAQTRPLLGLISCFILPKSAAKFVRALYYIWFYAIMSNAMERARLGHYRPVKVPSKAGEAKGKLQEGWDFVSKLIPK